MFKPCVVRVLVYIIIKIINVQRVVSILLSLKSERGINKTVKSSSANKYNFIRIPLAFFQNHLQTHCSMLSTFNYRYTFLSANVRGLFHYVFSKLYTCSYNHTTYGLRMNRRQWCGKSDWFRLCCTNRPKCAECPSINTILFHIFINYAVF